MFICDGNNIFLIFKFPLTIYCISTFPTFKNIWGEGGGGAFPRYGPDLDFERALFEKTWISIHNVNNQQVFIVGSRTSRIKNEYNSEEHLGNLIFKLNKIKLNRIRFIFRFYFKPSSETNYKKIITIVQYILKLEQSQFFGRFYSFV